MQVNSLLHTKPISFQHALLNQLLNEWNCSCQPTQQPSFMSRIWFGVIIYLLSSLKAPRHPKLPISNPSEETFSSTCLLLPTCSGVGRSEQELLGTCLRAPLNLVCLVYSFGSQHFNCCLWLLRLISPYLSLPRMFSTWQY